MANHGRALSPATITSHPFIMTKYKIEIIYNSGREEPYHARATRMGNAGPYAVVGTKANSARQALLNLDHILR